MLADTLNACIHDANHLTIAALLREIVNCHQVNQSTLKEISPEYSLEGLAVLTVIEVGWARLCLGASHPQRCSEVGQSFLFMASVFPSFVHEHTLA